MSIEITFDDYLRNEGVLTHIGTMDQSGRYERGSGEDPYQRVRRFAEMDAKLTREIPNEKERALALGFKQRDGTGNTSEYRKYRSVASGEKRNLDRLEAEKLKARNWSNKAIAEKLGVSATKVADLLKPREDMKQNAREKATEALKTQVDRVGYLDVGKGTESSMGITEDMKKKALYALQMQGYETYNIKEKTAIGNDNNTLVLAKPGTTFQDARDNIINIKPYVGKIDEFDRNANPLGFEKPIAVNPKRVEILWKEDGGAKADGVVYVRPGVEDISLGKNRYAQVRIQVGDGHYIKGMAVYKDDLPKGVDLLVNSNKPKSDDKMSALKKLERDKRTGEVDENNPFGSIVKQLKKDGPNGPGTGEVYSAMNIVNEEEEGWDRWSKNLSSQFLSKQSIPLARTQLEITRAKRQSDYDEIMSLENPVVKKHMLDKFADSSDAAAEHLKAAALPGQKTHVLLPINSLKPNEIHAPNFDNGDSVVLVRYPHGGTFEIPELIVNNKNKEAEAIIGKNAKAAVGIHHTVAEQLSGADFDGDTVVVIPNNHRRVRTRPPLKELEGFDTKDAYGPTPDQAAAIEKGEEPYKIMPPTRTNNEMGTASNLLTDMTIKGASDEEIARATRHSMVVIDAAKHKLDYQRSYQENRIKDLKDKYQDGGGASTLISRARGKKAVEQVRLRKASEGGSIDPDTGELVYVPTGTPKRKQDANGDWYDSDEPKQMKRTQMSIVKDASELSSGTAMEELYADHANSMKSMANQARREWLHTKDPLVNKEAQVRYAKEVAELDEALVIAKANAPRERHAQRVAAHMMQIRKAEHPDMDKSEIKKLTGATLRTAREATGANKSRIKPTDEQWEAIQAGAISATKLREILANGDVDSIYDLALPKERKTVTTSQEARIRAMSAQGKTQAEIAEALGVSTSTVSSYI